MFQTWSSNIENERVAISRISKSVIDYQNRLIQLQPSEMNSSQLPPDLHVTALQICSVWHAFPPSSTRAQDI